MWRRTRHGDPPSPWLLLYKYGEFYSGDSQFDSQLMSAGCQSSWKGQRTSNQLNLMAK